jgi:hypothetical protein
MRPVGNEGGGTLSIAYALCRVDVGKVLHSLARVLHCCCCSEACRNEGVQMLCCLAAASFGPQGLALVLQSRFDGAYIGAPGQLGDVCGSGMYIPRGKGCVYSVS